MSARIEIDMGLNASGVARGAKDAASALADLEDAVGDVADESSKSGKKVDSFADKVAKAAKEAGKSDDEIKDALRGYGVNAKEAERAIEKVGDGFKDAGRDGERAMDDLEDSLRDVQRGTDDVGEAGDKGLRKLGDSSKEVGDELKQNLGETFSSFRGDLEDLPQIAQDTLGGLAGSGALGGIPGLAAAAGGAAGLGLIIGAMETMNEKTEELQGRAGDMAQAFIEAGSTTLDALTIAGATADIISDPEKRKSVQEYADALGTDFATAARAYVGDANAMAVVDKLAADARAESTAIADEQRESLEALTPAQQAIIEQNSKLLDAQRELNTVVSDASSQFSDQQAVLQGLIADAGTAAVEVDALGNRLITLPDGEKILIEADTGNATTNVDKFEGDVDGTIDHLNGRDVVLDVQTGAAIRAAQNAVNRIGNMSATVTLRADTSRIVSAARNALNSLNWD